MNKKFRNQNMPSKAHTQYLSQHLKKYNHKGYRFNYAFYTKEQLDEIYNRLNKTLLHYFQQYDYRR